VRLHSVLILLFATAAAAQDFDVASVKLHVPKAGEGNSSKMTGGPATEDPGRIVVTNRTLRTLIIEAYGIRNFQIEHPGWMGDLRYDIVAKVPAGASHQDSRVMMRKLLEDRFELKIRREMRDLSVYGLTIAKGGLKMTQSTATAPGVSGENLDMSKLKTGSDGFSQLPAGAQTILTNYTAAGAKTIGARQTISKIVTWLTGEVDKPVFDETGLKGEYNFSMVWAPPHNQNLDTAADIFTALPKQLGLKLEPRKRPVEMLIVESGRKDPIEN
jgi:uncharacterized protein (TIGR03435 family)